MQQILSNPQFASKVSQEPEQNSIDSRPINQRYTKT